MDIVYDLELNETNIQAEQPENILVKLKPHQLTSLNKAIDMENNGNINYKVKNHSYFNEVNIGSNELTEINIGTNVGILADKVGYGKTLIALSIIANNPINNIHINPNFSKTFNNDKTYGYLNISIKNNLIKKERDVINSTLVIVPRGPVFVQWEETIKTKTSLKLLSISNLTFIKQKLPLYTGNNKDEIFDFFESYDIILIKNTTLITLIKSYYNFEIINSWKRVMVDEAHEIISKIPSHINYHYLWLISGTYIDLFKKNNSNTCYIDGIKRLFDTFSINLLLVKNDLKFIQDSFHIPEPIEKTYLCKLPTDYLIAKKYLNSAILEKINANDFAGAIKDLGGKNETEDNIIELVSKEIKKDLKNKEREREYINDLDMNEDDKESKLKKIDGDIENIKNKLNDLTERMKSLSTKNCLICMDNLRNPIMLECTHIYCGSCIMKWISTNNNCPYCRKKIPSYDNLVAIVNEKKKNPEIIMSKEDTFISIIKNKPDGRYLVFTKNDNGFEIIKNKMIENDIKFEFLKGNTLHMMNVLEKFKKGEIKIILLNTQYAGSGIDINYATDVIIYHSMGLEKQQAIGRAQRVGRTEQLYIHNLAYEHEI
jgi:superfamily II DNA or RNA helicase